MLSTSPLTLATTIQCKTNLLADHTLLLVKIPTILLIIENLGKVGEGSL